MYCRKRYGRSWDWQISWPPKTRERIPPPIVWLSTESCIQLCIFGLLSVKDGCVSHELGSGSVYTHFRRRYGGSRDSQAQWPLNRAQFLSSQKDNGVKSMHECYAFWRLSMVEDTADLVLKLVYMCCEKGCMAVKGAGILCTSTFPRFSSCH